MTPDEALDLLRSVRNPLVRVDPKSRGHSMGSGWMRARLFSVNGPLAVIQPMGHRREETVDVRYLKPWHAKNAQNGAIIVPKDPERFKPLSTTLGEALNAKIQPEMKTENLETKNLEIEKIEKEKIEGKEEPMNKHGVRYSEERKEEVRKLRAMGKSYDAIVTITGISMNTVKGICDPIHKERAKAATIRYKEKLKIRKGKAPSSSVGFFEIPKTPEPTITHTDSNVKVVKETRNELAGAISKILSLNIPDTSKLLAIEGLVSHE